MVLVFLQFSLLLNSITVDATVCQSGWFGDTCRHECHCTSATLCAKNGECSNGKCLKAFFGPSCQFLDMAYRFGTSDTPQYIKDANDFTCNPNKSATSAFVGVKTKIQLLWFRMYVNDQRNILNFTVSVNGNETCVNGSKFKNSSFVDVICHTEAVLSKLYINGPVAANICSIYISFGMNTARKQMTSQSSNYKNNSNYESSRAVDGVKYNAETAFCAQTDYEDAPQWRLQLDREYLISFIFILFKSLASTVPGYIIECFNDNSETTFIYTDKTVRDYDIDMYISPSRVLSRLVISYPKDEETRKKLHICEVETFGENFCPEGTYGLQCEEKCQCDNRSICSRLNGLCSEVCELGFYGFNCDSMCEENCMGGLCHQVTGQCDQCNPGFIGEFCDSECLPGFWGPQCQNECFENCAEICNNINGTCQCLKQFHGNNCSDCSDGYYKDDCSEICPQFCKMCDRQSGLCLTCLENRKKPPVCEGCVDGKWGPICADQCSLHCSDQCNQTNGYCICLEHFTGLMCSECSSGYYGVNCTEICPKFCNDRVCDRQSGECLSCLGKRFGIHCDECPVKTYGVSCELKCSEYCQNQTCDHLTGKCRKCIRGRSGDDCVLFASKPAAWIAPLSAIPFLLLILFCIPNCPVDDSHTELAEFPHLEN